MVNDKFNINKIIIPGFIITFLHILLYLSKTETHLSFSFIAQAYPVAILITGVYYLYISTSSNNKDLKRITLYLGCYTLYILMYTHWRINHLSGASDLLMASYIVTAALVILLSYRSYFKPYLLHIGIAIVIYSFGLLNKRFHFPGALITILTGASLIVLFYSLRALKKRNKEIIDYLKVALLMIYLVGVCARMFHIPFFSGALIQLILDLIILGLLYLYLLGIKKYNDDISQIEDLLN